MSISAVGSSQFIQNFTVGDDVIAFAQAVQFMRADALSGTVSAAAEAVREQTNRVYALYTLRDKLVTLPDVEGDKDKKVLGNLTSAAALLKSLADFGYSLETQQRLQVSSETFDADGKRISSDKHLATPEELTTIQGYDYVGTDSRGRETYEHKENEGTSEETTTKVVVFTRDGLVTASAEAVSALVETIEARTRREEDKLSASLDELEVLIKNLGNNFVIDGDVISDARHAEELARETRLEEKRQQESEERASEMNEATGNNAASEPRPDESLEPTATAPATAPAAAAPAAAAPAAAAPATAAHATAAPATAAPATAAPATAAPATAAPATVAPATVATAATAPSVVTGDDAMDEADDSQESDHEDRPDDPQDKNAGARKNG
jgi:hypothetical protein